MIFAMELKGISNFFLNIKGIDITKRNLTSLCLKNKHSVENIFKILDEAIFVCLKDKYETGAVLENQVREIQ